MGDNADFFILGFQNWPLLDMQLIIGVHLTGADFLFADPADAFYFLVICFAFQILTTIGIVKRIDASKYTRGEHWWRETCAFLIGPVRHDNRMFGFDFRVVERADQSQGRQYTQYAIIFATGGLGVEVRADIDG